MLFSGIPFLYYFLPLVLAVYFLAPAGWKNAVLAFFSLLFYGWGEPVYLLLLVLTLTFTYGMGRLAGRAAPERLWAVTAAAVTVQLLLLVVFKYAGLLFLGGGKTVFPLPLGISFYTFQMVSYTVDLYRGSVKPARSLVDFATYAAAFPQLIAGPIVRYQEVDQQMAHRRHSADAFYAGLRRFLVGLGKKVLLANQLALLGETFRRSAEPSVLFYWLYAVSFTLQIYFDFSGYSDMAVGLGKLFGFTYPENFRYPYTSRSITEFWRRWHITLGGWFRDYVYIHSPGRQPGKTGAVAFQYAGGVDADGSLARGVLDLRRLGSAVCRADDRREMALGRVAEKAFRFSPPVYPPFRDAGLRPLSGGELFSGRQRSHGAVWNGQQPPGQHRSGLLPALLWMAAVRQRCGLHALAPSAVGENDEPRRTAVGGGRNAAAGRAAAPCHGLSGGRLL